MRSTVTRVLARHAGARLFSAAGAAPRTGRTLAGSVGSATLLVVSGSVIIWPLADLVAAPRIIARGCVSTPSDNNIFGPSLDARARHHESDPASQRLRSCLSRLLDAVNGAAEKSGAAVGAAQLVLVSGPGGSGKTLATRALCEEGSERPALYISLREAAAPHDLLFAVTSHLYSSRRLGPIGTVSQSLGIFWICLFDMAIGHTPAHTRAVHFSQVLSHARRALRLQQQANGGRRTLLVFDHYTALLGPVPGGSDEGRYYGQMADRLRQWCEAVVFDEGLADIVVVGGERMRSNLNERRVWHSTGGIIDRVAKIEPGGAEVCLFRNADEWGTFLAARSVRPE